MKTRAIAASLLTLGLGGCQREIFAHDSARAEAPELFNHAALAVIRPVGSSGVRGVIHFQQEGPTVRVIADLQGLQPGRHALHVHDYGDCTSVDATSAGRSFNFVGDVFAVERGDVRRIVGNLGDVDVSGDGSAHLDAAVPLASLNGRLAIAGRSVIVHANPNDPSQMPEGGAGARLACGVIGLEQPPARRHLASSD